MATKIKCRYCDTYIFDLLPDSLPKKGDLFARKDEIECLCGAVYRIDFSIIGVLETKNMVRYVETAGVGGTNA